MSDQTPAKSLFSMTSTKRLVHAIEDPTDVALLKGALILYPNVVLGTFGGPYDSIVEFVTKGLNRSERKHLNKCFQPVSEIEGYEPDVRTSRLLETLLDTPGIAKEKLKHKFLEIETAWEKAVHGRPDGGVFYQDPFGDFDPLVALFMLRQMQLPYHEHGEREQEIRGLFQKLAFDVHSDEVVEAAVPAIEPLSWGQIVELRNSPYISKFREYIFRFGGGLEQLEDEIIKGLWSIAGEVRPSKTGSAVKRLTALIPTGAVPNPYAVFREGKGGEREWKLYHEYGWVFFIQEARAAVKMDTDTE
jgi:hypothetical protein